MSLRRCHTGRKSAPMTLSQIYIQKFCKPPHPNHVCQKHLENPSSPQKRKEHESSPDQRKMTLRNCHEIMALHTFFDDNPLVSATLKPSTGNYTSRHTRDLQSHALCMSTNQPCCFRKPLEHGYLQSSHFTYKTISANIPVPVLSSKWRTCYHSYLSQCPGQRNISVFRSEPSKTEGSSYPPNQWLGGYVDLTH